MRRFAFAPMDATIRVLTGVVLTLPPLFAVIGASGAWPAWGVAALLALVYGAVWLWWRPTGLEVGDGVLRLVFPARVRDVPLADVAGVRALSREEFRREYKFGLRIGVGGLWGGFGWLYTARGLVEFYITRTDDFVIVRREAGRDLMLTPADVAGFVAALPR